MFRADAMLISQMLPKKVRLLLINLLRYYIAVLMLDLL